MKVVINKNKDVGDIEVIINCNTEDENIHKIVNAIQLIELKFMCRKDNKVFYIYLDNVLYFESVDRKTFVYTSNDIYETDKRIYELEELLKNHSFFRVSKAIVVNLQKVSSLRPEFGSRLLLTMDNGEKILVSRQYSGKIKENLEVL